MSFLDQFNQANQTAATSITQLATMFPAQSAGLMPRRLKAMQARARARWGLAGYLAAGLLRLIAGLVLACVFMAGMLWATVGSFALITSKTWLWGYRPSDYSKARGRAGGREAEDCGARA
jgi:hypothetical protein